MRARWLPLIVGGAWNAELRRTFDEVSGVYAIRRKSDRVVEYVGESHTGRGWKTLQRHFQDYSGTFKDRSEYTRASADGLECALWVTSSGPRSGKGEGDQAALDLQAKLIAKLRPKENRDDGQAYPLCEHGVASWRCARRHALPLGPKKPKAKPPRKAKPRAATADDDFAFGANVNPRKPLGLERRDADGRYNHGMDRVCGRCGHRKGEHEAEKPYAQDDASSGFQCDGFKAAREKKNPPALPAPNVAAERKAENRTPDLFTGRTKLEEGGKGARKDWKGEAERTARELAECRRGAASTKKSAPDTTSEKIAKIPTPKPEGFGELDAKGQAGMFKRNPPPAERRAIALLGPGGKLTATKVGSSWVAVGTSKSGAEVATGHGRSRVAAVRAALASLENDERRAADAKNRRDVERRDNPARLSMLGGLVSIVYRDASGRRRTLRFAAGAAIVAYVPSTSRLVLIFAAKVAGASSSAGRAEYAKKHWGAKGAGNRLEGDTLGGKAPKLGTALEITYVTRKGSDAKPVDYWHVFGDYGPLSLKKSFVPPALHAATVGGRQLLRLDGGSYTVTTHGIVG